MPVPNNKRPQVPPTTPEIAKNPPKKKGVWDRIVDVAVEGLDPTKLENFSPAKKYNQLKKIVSPKTAPFRKQ